MSKVEWKKQYYEDGTTLCCETPYVDGQPHGVQNEYHKDGTLLYETAWVNGQRHGVHKEYHSNGALIYETSFVNGQVKPNLSKLEKLVLLGIVVNTTRESC